MSVDKKPAKGILKPSSSFDKEGHLSRSAPADKGMKWDEMNILATYHPADKDYGHTKIDEPPTPYNRLSESEGEPHSGDEDTSLDPQSLVDSLEMDAAKPKVMTKDESSEEEDDEELTEEEREKKRAFAKRRKLHYNEFQAVKLARQLIDNDDEEEEDQEVIASGNQEHLSSSSASHSSSLKDSIGVQATSTEGSTAAEGDSTRGDDDFTV